MYGMWALGNNNVGKKKVQIDKSRWYRGQTGDKSRLCRPEDGMKCCLGFKLNADGFTDNELRGKFYPAGVCPPNHSWLTGADGRDTTLSALAAQVNDAPLGQLLYLAQSIFSPLGNIADFLTLYNQNGEISKKPDDNEFFIIRSEPEREEILTKLFAYGGDEVEFLDVDENLLTKYLAYGKMFPS